MSARDALWYVVESRILRGDQTGKWTHEATIHFGGEYGRKLAQDLVTARQRGMAGQGLTYTRQFRILAMTEVEKT